MYVIKWNADSNEKDNDNYLTRINKVSNYIEDESWHAVWGSRKKAMLFKSQEEAIKYFTKSDGKRMWSSGPSPAPEYMHPLNIG